MSALFIATPKVRHLATWTADEPASTADLRGWAPGSSRPICGARHHRSAITIYADSDPDWYDPRYARRYVAAMRRPVCRHCLATLAALTDLTDRSTP